MGLAIQGDNISIYKAYIKDIKSLNNLTLLFLFSDANKFNPGLIFKDLLILTRVEEIMIIYIYMFIYRLHMYIASNINILTIFTLSAKIH
jgi:hypothetical protein